jgi:uncharacterized protein YlxW (UPF0749 family)
MMNCENLDNLIIWTLIFTIVLDCLGLFTELTNQRCEKKAEKEKAAREDAINRELEDLRKRVALLEKQSE